MIMNKICNNYQKLIFAFLLFISAGFSACTMKDELTVVPPKTLEEYKTQFSEYLAKQKMMADTARVGFNKNNYKTTTDSATVKVPYLTALAAAQAVIDNPAVTVAQIVTADKALATPAKAFWDKIWIADRRQLNDSIVAATALNTATVQGNLGGQVLADAKTAFTTAITKASAARGTSILSDLQLKLAGEALTVAKKAFVAAIIPLDFNTFLAKSKAYIAEQKTLVEASVAGYNAGEYLALNRTNYLNAVLAANDSVNKAGISFDGVSKALTNMVVPKAAFVSMLTDHRPLNDTITLAESLYPGFVVGTAKGQVVTAAKTAFTTAITTAKTARDNVALTPGATNAARYKMGQAIFTIQASIVLGDLIIDATALKAAIAVGTGVGQVSSASNFVYNKAITDATAIRNSGTSTYAQMTAAIEALKTATTTFTNSIKK